MPISENKTDQKLMTKKKKTSRTSVTFHGTALAAQISSNSSSSTESLETEVVSPALQIYKLRDDVKLIK